MALTVFANSPVMRTDEPLGRAIGSGNQLASLHWSGHDY